MVEINGYARGKLEMKASDFIPGLIGFVVYMQRNPEIMLEGEIKIRDRNASILANVNVASTVTIIYGIVEGINYLV